MDKENQSNQRPRQQKQVNKNKNKNEPSEPEFVPWQNQEICIVENSNQSQALATRLRSSCKNYNVLGIECNVIEFISRKVALLLLSTYDGLCAIIRLSTLRRVPTELKAILEDDNILKVTVHPVKVAWKLNVYGVLVASVFDLRYLVTKCGFQASVLSRLSMEHLKVRLTQDYRLEQGRWKGKQLDKRDVDYAAKVVRVAIELFKLFEEKINAGGNNDLQKFIDEHCKAHLNISYRYEKSTDQTETNVSERVLPQPMICLINSEDRCKAFVQQLREYTSKNKVLGFGCKCSAARVVTLLQLATHEGLCAFIQLSKVKPIPDELKELLEDETIIKVGEKTFAGADRLERDYAIRVTNTLDLRHLAKECKYRAVDLDRLSKELLNVDVSVNDWRLLATDWKANQFRDDALNHAAKTVQVTIELFKVFEEKLVEEKCLDDRTKFIDEICRQYLNEDFPKQKSNENAQGAPNILPEPNIQTVSNAEECKEIVEQLLSHCAEYNVLGFDCEWVPRGSQRVAMLQLATHRGLCALIRLCKMKQIPNELRTILKDKTILKVGITPRLDANKLAKDYRLEVNGTFDLKRLAKKCKYRETGLASLAEKVLNVKMPLKKSGLVLNKLHKKWENDTLDDVHIKYAANDVHVSIELFKNFEEKLMANNRAKNDNQTKNLQDFIEQHCSSK